MGRVPGRPHILRDPRDRLTAVDYISTTCIQSRTIKGTLVRTVNKIQGQKKIYEFYTDSKKERFELIIHQRQSWDTVILEGLISINNYIIRTNQKKTTSAEESSIEP